ncbi:virion structural protein [Erwinia phage vB_EamM_Asesino]|uniref:Virion structural protein n=1 Tax=Erwinia phage vB_EamM_Asesino TaxID=1883370 RepID=A0A1B2IA79_9CAUD|nr:virion structural protein [Erwinia phage vB_EamM_Asesino]ANZ48170.1 putative virion structural protein [Erwinia phage vB_EamM_Asesino]
MPILNTAEKLILAEINVENGLDLKDNEVSFGVPSIPTEPDDATKANGHNSMVRVQALPIANATGHTTVYYDRLDFSEMFTGLDGIQPLRVPARLDSVFTAHDVVPLINQYYGLKLKTSDVENTDINRSSWVVELVATADSLGWLGSIEVQLLPGDALLPSNFDPTSVNPYEYPYFNTKVGQGAVYGYPWRFDDYAVELAAMGASATDAKLVRLAQILQKVTSDLWTVYRNPINFNLKETTFVYNGKNTVAFPTNPSYDNVLVIELSLYCLNLGGRMYIHYNDPE